jgi:co-chaperonin GroES (HSP10)
MKNSLLEKFNYNIKYTKGDSCILIDPKNWVENTTNIVQTYSIDGKAAMNYMTTVLKENIDEEIFGKPLNEGDLVILTKIASKVSYLKPFEIAYNFGKNKYSHIHVMQVIGKFEDNIISLDTLTPLFDKVIMEEIKVSQSSILFIDEEQATSVGKVIKVGSGGFTNKWKHRDMEVSVGDYVLLRDNITTSINIDNKDYICTEDSMIMGKFKDGIIDMKNIELFHDNIILEEKQEEKALGSSILFSPTLDLEEEDISEIYQRDRFKVINKSDKVNDVDVDDVIIINRDCTNYIIFKGTKYFTIKGTKQIEGKIK